MDVAVLIVAVLVLSVGLPVAAALVSRARIWRRPAASSYVDLLYVEARRHRLSASQIEQVSRAIARGVAAPAELRGVTAEVAAAKVAQLEKGLYSRRRRRLVLAYWVVLAVALMLVFLFANHDFSRDWFPIVETLTVGVLLSFVWRRELRRARLAVELNRGQPVDERPR